MNEEVLLYHEDLEEEEAHGIPEQTTSGNHPPGVLNSLQFTGSPWMSQLLTAASILCFNWTF